MTVHVIHASEVWSARDRFAWGDIVVVPGTGWCGWVWRGWLIAGDTVTADAGPDTGFLTVIAAQECEEEVAGACDPWELRADLDDTHPTPRQWEDAAAPRPARVDLSEHARMCRAARSALTAATRSAA